MERKYRSVFFKTAALILSLTLAASTLTGCWLFEPREEEQPEEEIVLEVPEPNQEELVEEDDTEMEAQVDPELQDTEEVGEVTEEPQSQTSSNTSTQSSTAAQSSSGEKQEQFSQTSSQQSGNKTTTTSSSQAGSTTSSSTGNSGVTTSAQTPESVVKPEKNTGVVYEPVGAQPSSPSSNQVIVQTSSGAPKPVAGKSYTSARFNKAGSYSESKVYKNGYIDAGNVTISNKTFTGDLYIDVPSGTVTLKNVDIQGTIRLTDGSDWVKLYDVNAGALTIDNSDLSRVFASRDTAVNAVSVKSSAVLEEGGLFTSSVGFRDITVDAAKGSSLTLRNLNLNKLRINTACDVVYDGNTIINYLYTYAATELYGNGQINRLYCNANGVYYDTKPLYIQTGKGYATPSRRSSSSGSGSSTQDKKVTLHDISDQYISIGDTHIVAIDHNGSSLRVTTNNPSVAKVTYSTSKSRITMTGLKAGKATIKITSSRSGYTSSTISFNIIVKESGSSSIQLSGIANQTLDKGSTRYVTVNTDASRISVTNSNTKVADVTTDGFQLRIRAKAAGTTTVKVTASRTGYSSKSTSFKVTVREPSSSSDTVYINRIDNQIISKGSQRVVNVRTDGTSLSATSNNEKIAKVRVSGSNALIVEAVSPGSATITVVSSRRGYTSATTAFCVDVYGDTISAPTVYMNYPNSTSYPNGSWTNQDIKFILTGYSSNRTAYSYERPAGGTSSQWGTRRELSNGTLTITAEGQKDYYFFTRGTGGDSVATSIYTVRIDKTKPQINVTSSANNTLTFTVSDALSGINTVRILDENNQVYWPTSSGGSYTFTAKTSGNYRVEAIDRAGNVQLSGFFALSGQTQPDTKKPVITVKTKLEDKWYREAQNISFTVTDNVGIKNVSVDPTMPLSQASDGTYTFTAEREGNITYTITAKDTSDNRQTTQVTVKLDRTAPAIDKVEIGNPTQKPSTRLVTVTATDTTSGIQTIKVVEEGQMDSVKVDGSDGTYTFNATEGKKYTITAVDNAGNESVSQIINVETQVQPIEPAVSISDVTVSNENTMTKSKTLSFKVAATLADNQSLQVSVTDAQGKQQPAANALGGVQTSYSVLLTANGTYNITASVVEGDVVQKSDTKEQKIENIDSANPVISITENSNGTLKFTVVDENLKEVKLNDEVLTASSGNTYEKTGLTAGEYTIVATDKAGNTAEQKITVTLLQPPTVTAHATSLNSTDRQKAETTITVDAHDSKIKEVKVDATGAAATKQSDTTYLFSATENGSYTVIFVAENGTASSIDLTVSGIQKDQLPPTIQTGEPVTNAAANTATVEITATDPDNPGGVVQLKSDKGSLTGSGNAYTLTATENGNYTLTATDESGKTSTYTVTIDSIKANIAPSITAEPVVVSGKTGTVKLIVNDNNGTAITSVADQTGTPAAAQGDGSYLLTVTDNITYTITVTNAAGLTAQTAVTVTGLDLSAPMVAQPQVTLNENKTSATVTWTVTDIVDGVQGSGVGTVTFAGNVVAPNENGVYIANVSDNGNYTVVAADNAGNSTSETVAVTGIDKIAPTIQTTSDNSAWKKEHTVTFGVNDENSGVAAVKVTRDGAEISCTEGDTEYSFTADQNGTYVISASDMAGNQAVPVSVVITTVDATPPEAPKLMKDEKAVNLYDAQTGKEIYDTDTKATFTVSYQKATEGQSPVSVKMKLDNAEFTTLTEQTMKLTLKAGEHTVVLKTVDAAGNESQPVTYHFKVKDAEAASTTTEKTGDAATQTDGPTQPTE